MARRQKRVLTSPPGPAFLRTLAEGILNGEIVEGFVFDPAQPETLADVTVFVPTRRAARVLRSEFALLLSHGSAILPTIRPLGETDDDSGFFEASLPETLDLLPPVGPVAAALELARLITVWRNSLPEAVVNFHGGAPVIAPASPADAVWLAKELIALIGEVETAEIGWDNLDKLNTQDYASWWQLTLEFLKIAHVYWPARLEELNASSASRHRNAVLKAEVERLATAVHRGPVIVAGSTGSLPATARLIDAVSQLDEGAVVLPGLDLHMPPAQWDCLALPSTADGTGIDPTIFGHPQFGLARLLDVLHLKRDDVGSYGRAEPAIDTRTRAVSLALAPSASTHLWPEMKAEIGESAMTDAFADVALMEAPNERLEATAIAVALKLALDTAGSDESQVALITPDRGLARRVVAELERFGIEADDSGGTPLNATPQGTLLKLLIESTLFPGDPVPIVSLLKHPLTRLALPPETMAKAARLLEVHALRGGTGAVDISTLAPLMEAQAERAAQARHEPAWRAPLSAGDLALALDAAARIAIAAEPLVEALVRRLPGQGFSITRSTAEWAERTGRALEAFAADEAGDVSALWTGEAGEALADLLSGVMEAPGGLALTGADWAGVLDALVADVAVKPRAMSHPRVFIWGTQEARLQHVDTIVLGGMNEGVWPQQAGTNPFLSRIMKIRMGLEPPERRAGQIAHDFQMASGMPHVIYSRALRAGSAPSVASRFLQRLTTIAGPELTKTMRQRGEYYLRCATLIDEGERQPLALRPEPKPDSNLIPIRYSFSEAGKLRRDPYAVYARRILRLDPVDPFNADPGPAERGTLYHAIIEAFVGEKIDPASEAATAALAALADRAFAEADLPAHIEATWRPRFDETARAFLDWEKKRQANIKQSFTEARAIMPLDGGFELTGYADRIDITRGGVADIIDYKTGSSPSLKQARTLIDPQLSLEAAALQAGGFADVGAREPGDLIYVRLRPGDRFKFEIVNGDPASSRSKTPPKTSAQLAEDAARELVKLLTLLKTGKRGFLSRVLPESAAIIGDYDHLARVAEWTSGEDSDEGDTDG
ncbi:double-strand break repair protein AddB [Rhizobium sp. C1]|uniref:double-strand break repair protein AddB n=1 Tax=Rhizobium sp. C1 TaxID=1349799 RepID=UPI001E483A03|nr:double-strand break repair protein AddB [Rhizobium sp. C1]MCD2178528.1 double-strand break repair protein AddB [Rhizobium sp. C1]